MNLPNYFLADLPAEATLTPGIIAEACSTLRQNRERYLAGRTTAQMIELLSRTAEDWLNPAFPFRQRALELGPGALGFSRSTLANGLDAFFSQLTADNLHHLLIQELGHSQRLDAMVAAGSELQARHLAMATGPELLAHITAGNIPAPGLMSLVLGLLLRSAQFVKCASGTSLLPRLFAHSLYQVEPKVGACLELAEWPGGREDLEAVLFESVDCITATGGDETLGRIRNRLPSSVRFIGYGHRVSFGYVAHENLSRRQAAVAAERAAEDVTAWNQLGCLSPHLFYVEQGGGLPPEEFTQLLAAELERRETSEPRGEVSLETAAVIAARRDFYQVRATYSLETRLWSSRDSTAWTVVYEADATFQRSCLHRFVFVKPVRDLADALHHAANVRGRVSTVGLAAPLSRAPDLAARLARWGVSRICPLGQMQRPPLTWRHDGRPSLGDLVIWTNWEQ